METFKSEIFRHLRPLLVDDVGIRMTFHPMGGVSFLLRPEAEKVYSFWVYICPSNATFSSRQAVKSLRDRANSGIVPYGTIKLDNTPLIHQLISAVLSNSTLLPSEVPEQIKKIQAFNQQSQKQLDALRSSYKDVINEYQGNSIR